MVLGRLMLVTGVLLLAYCLVLAGSAMAWLLAAGVVCFVGYLAKHGRKRLMTLGSARWADADHLRRAGMLDSMGGLILGRLTDNRRSR